MNRPLRRTDPHAAFRLPEGKVQVALSGGRTSAYLLHRLLEANGPLPEDRVVVTFQNTGREMPATLDFVAEIGRRWGVMVTWLEYRAERPFFEIVGRQGASVNGEPFEALIRKRRFLPNQDARSCTTELKVRTAKRYCVSLGWKRWTNCVGFRADEPSRLVNLPRSWDAKDETETVVNLFGDAEVRPKKGGTRRPRDRWIVWTPLADAGITKHDVALFWRGQDFDLALPIVNGKTPLGNCDGCFLKSEDAVATLARDHPERHAWWEDMETLAADLAYAKGETPGRGACFSKRYTRRAIRETVEKHGDWIFDAEGAFCQADDGDCFG